jgi:biopolymer transport protein ExbD
MSFGSFNEGGSSMPMADINTTPLVDVMLVLLVIFIITAPIFNQAVPIDLPKVNATKLDEKPQILRVSLDPNGQISVNNQIIHSEMFEAHCRAAREASSNTEMHLRADRNTRYEKVTEVMASAQKAGIEKIAFVTEPAR